MPERAPVPKTRGFVGEKAGLLPVPPGIDPSAPSRMGRGSRKFQLPTEAKLPTLPNSRERPPQKIPTEKSSPGTRHPGCEGPPAFKGTFP